MSITGYMPQIVIDTNVMIAGLRSRRGKAFRLLELVGTGIFEINLSVPLLLEYKDVLYRLLPELGITRDVVDSVLDYHCSIARIHEIFFLWRPFLPDPKDDMVLELAVRAQCNYILTYNIRDFAGIEQFGIQAVTPQIFFAEIGLKP